MTTPSDFVLSHAATEAMLAECRLFGAQRVETGGFILVKRGASVASTVAVAGVKGILRDPRLFDITGAANDKLQDWSIDRDEVAAVQWHTHRFDAYMSETDLACGINVPGMITAIIPEFESPPGSPQEWGWWMFDQGEWREIAPPAQSSESVAVVRFDEEGVSDEE